ncbi:MAG: hypothetical protein K8T89_11485, partial [Planctomycetes bacterium]|nr:hypothetical protein [Planctomycetota bacterium]
MTRRIRQSLALLGLSTLLLPGCLSAFNPVPKATCELRQTCEQIPVPCRQQVYVVLINGTDPLCCGNLSGARDYLNSLGFVKSYYAQLYHEGCLLKELRDVHQTQPDARFAIVGFEYGAIPARKLAARAAQEGINVDLLVYLQPKGLGKVHESDQLPVRRLLTIQSGTSQAADSEIAKGEIVSIPCWSRYAVPTHPAALEMLGTELTHLARNVSTTVVTVNASSSLLDDPAPSPRPITARTAEKSDAWDFLKPVSRQKTVTAEPAPIQE